MLEQTGKFLLLKNCSRKKKLFREVNFIVDSFFSPQLNK